MAALLPCRPITELLCGSRKKRCHPTSGVPLRSLSPTVVIFRAVFGWRLRFSTLKTRPLTIDSSFSPRSSISPRLWETQIGGKSLSIRPVTALGRLRSPATARLSNLIHLLGKNDEYPVLSQVTAKLVYRIANGIDSAASHGG